MGTASGVAAPSSHAPRLKITRLSKTFGHTRVLDDVRLIVEPGEIHALVGANGSGKSTLIKVLSGYHAPDRGAELAVDGHDVSLPIRPTDLARVGISVVHQDLGLIDHLSVAENISVGHEPRPMLRRLHRRDEADHARAVLSRLNVVVDVNRPVRELPPEQRATVAIARALTGQIRGRGLIVLDESTRALSHEGATAFYQTLKHAVRDGGSVLMVAHSLPEVMAVADRVTVIRDGKVAADGVLTAELSEQEIARLMVGRDIEDIRVHNSPPPEAPTIRVENVHTGSGSPISFRIARGEIVGITGKSGDAWEALPYLLAGGTQTSSGTLRIHGEDIDLAKATVRVLLRNGVVLVPERRDVQGVASTLSVADNVTLPRMSTRGRPWFSGVRWLRGEVQHVINDLGVRPGDPQMPVGKLSGGNQQKVLLGKWLLSTPSLLVLHEPTQGVDVAARRDLLQAVLAAAEAGTAVLVITNDFNDLSAVCSRVLVIDGGQIKDVLKKPTPDEIVDAVYEGILVVEGGAA